MAVIAPAGRSFDFLLNQMRAYQGSLAGGTVEFYSAGTTILSPIWLDVNLQQIAANPYTLSADGIAELFGNGYYRIIVKNSNGVIVFDYDNVECKPVPTSGSTPPPSGGAGSTHVIVDCFGADQTYTLTEEYHQFITRTGDSNHILTIVPPGTNKFYSQQGVALQQFFLYGDGETVQFLLDNGLYYTVIG